MVEAVRHVDLARRVIDRARRHGRAVGRLVRNAPAESRARRPSDEPGCRFLPLAGAGRLRRRRGLAADPARPTRKFRSKLEGQPVPAFALPRGHAGQGGTVVGRPRDGSAAHGQRLRQLVRAVHRRSAAVARTEAPGRRHRRHRRPRPARGRGRLPRPPWRPVRPDRRRPESGVQLALGSSGVPESFVVDGRGIIRYQHMGPIDAGRGAGHPRARWEAAK